MAEKLDEQSGGDQHAREIRRQPGGIVDHLQHAAVVVGVEARLIEGFARVTQRVVHVNQHFAVFVVFQILQPDAAGEILGDVRAGIFVMPEFDQVQAERQVIPFLAQQQFIGAIVESERLRLVQPAGHEERAEGTLGSGDFDDGRRHVHPVHFRFARLFAPPDAGAETGGGFDRLIARLGLLGER